MPQRPYVEGLELRTLCAVDVAVAFQPITSKRPADMIVDYGGIYAVRRGGVSYGWQSDLSAQTIERGLAPVRKNDRFIQLNLGDTWNMAVPNGDYKVYMVGGDPARVNDRMAITVEGKVGIAGITRRAKPYLEAAVNVTVNDGKLTITSAGVWNTDKLNYIAIQSIDGDTTPVTPPDSSPVTTSTIKWTAGPKALVPRVEPEAVVVNNQFYVFSGYGDTAGGRSPWVPSATIDRYDPTTNKWTRVGTMPTPTTHAGVAVVGSNVWFVGGYTVRPGTIDRQDVANTNVLIYNTTNNTWSRGPSLPARRASGGLALVNNTLYFTSGEPADHVSNSTNTWSLDLANQSAGWKTRAPIPDGRSHFGIATVNNKIYIIGGQKGIDETSTMLKTNYVYDPATNVWTRLADLPVKRSHLSPAVIPIGNKIYAFGGEEYYNKELADVLEYDPATNKFTKLTSMPGARGSGGVGYVGGKIVFTGGKNNGFFSDTFIGTFV